MHYVLALAQYILKHSTFQFKLTIFLWKLGLGECLIKRVENRVSKKQKLGEIVTILRHDSNPVSMECNQVKFIIYFLMKSNGSLYCLCSHLQMSNKYVHLSLGYSYFYKAIPARNLFHAHVDCA
jgi:hypothetical protein